VWWWSFILLSFWWETRRANRATDCGHLSKEIAEFPKYQKGKWLWAIWNSRGIQSYTGPKCLYINVWVSEFVSKLCALFGRTRALYVGLGSRKKPGLVCASPWWCVVAANFISYTRQRGSKNIISLVLARSLTHSLYIRPSWWWGYVYVCIYISNCFHSLSLSHCVCVRVFFRKTKAFMEPIGLSPVDKGAEHCPQWLRRLGIRRNVRMSVATNVATLFSPHHVISLPLSCIWIYVLCVRKLVS